LTVPILADACEDHDRRSRRASHLVTIAYILSRKLGPRTIRILRGAFDTTNRISDVACFPSQQCGRTASTCTALRTPISSADILTFNRWDALQRAFFLSANPKTQLWTNIRSSPTLRPCLPIAYESFDGIDFQLPKNFEWRATPKSGVLLGRYSRAMGGGPTHHGPNGLYATFGVAGSFGGYGHPGAPWRLHPCNLRKMGSSQW